MRGALVVLGCTAALATRAHADDSPQDTQLRRAVLAAIGKRDASAFGAKLGEQPLRLYHVWFDTAACAKEFGGKVTVARGNVGRLVDCLARLGLAEGKDGTLVHAPGVAIVPLSYRGTLAGLSGVAVEASTPTVTDAALARNLVTGTLEVAPDPATRAAIDKADQVATVWLEACVDAAGTIGKISARKRTAKVGLRYAKAIEAAAARWTFRPFKRGDKAIRVCLQRRYVYPSEPL